MHMQRLLTLALAATLGGSAPAWSGEAPPVEKKPEAKKAVKKAAKKEKRAAPTTSGMKAFRDPHSGKLREPTEGELRQLERDAEEAGQAAPAGPTATSIVQGPDGTLTATLGEDAMMDVQATRNPDGTLSTRCVPRGQHLPTE